METTISLFGGLYRHDLRKIFYEIKVEIKKRMERRKILNDRRIKRKKLNQIDNITAIYLVGFLFILV